MLVNLIIQLISGAVGGNIVGAAIKQLSLGPIGNTIAGVVGGGIGGQILSAVMGGSTVAAGAATTAVGTGLDINAIVTQVVGGGVGGAIVMAIVGVIRQQMGGNKPLS
jgi:hypothetical protein